MLASEQRYLAEIILTQLTIIVPNFGPKNSNFACKSQIFRISFQKMLRSLGLGLGLETFAKFVRVSVLVSKNLASEKSLGFGFGKFWSRKKVSVSENLVSEENYRFRFRINLVSGCAPTGKTRLWHRFPSALAASASCGTSFGLL